MGAVVLLSGGLDSTANLAMALERGVRLEALTVDYGQRAASAEIQAAEKFCSYYDVPHEVLALKWLGALGGSALTDVKISPPEVEPEELDDLQKTQETARAVWVPNRNGVLIQVAAAMAEARGFQQVLVGFNREEAVTFPDNSAAFMDKANAALAYSTANHVEVTSFTSQMDKTEIAKNLLKLPKPFPFHWVASCYLAAHEPCGRCESCRRFFRAMESAGVQTWK